MTDTPLLEEIEVELKPEELERKVEEYWRTGVGWKWEELEGVLTQETLAKLKGYCVEQGEDNPDVTVWSPETRGDFTSAST